MGFYEEYKSLISDYTIEEVRKDLGRVVDFFKNQEYHNNAIDVIFVNERQLPRWVADEHDVFFISDELAAFEIPEWMKEEPLGLFIYNKLRQEGRLVYPVKDVKGNVMGLCGWDAFDKPKYLDSKNYGYKAKLTTFYGMEKLPEYYVSDKPLFVVEGIVCCLYLRSQGFNAVALLGSAMTAYVKTILRRFGSKLVIIPDNDEAGDSLARTAKRVFSKAQVIQVMYGKDIDGCRKMEEHKYEQELLNDLKACSSIFCNLTVCARS